MDEGERLERQCDAAMIDICHQATRLGYRPARLLEMVPPIRWSRDRPPVCSPPTRATGVLPALPPRPARSRGAAHVLLAQYAPLFTVGKAQSPAEPRPELLATADGRWRDPSDPRRDRPSRRRRLLADRLRQRGAPPRKWPLRMTHT